MTRWLILVVLVVMALATRGAAQERPKILLPIYGAFATSQALDATTTHLALSRGAGHEGNGLLAGCATDAACLVAEKAGISITTIWAIDRFVRPTHKWASAWLMGSLTAMQLLIDTHNYHVAAAGAHR